MAFQTGSASSMADLFSQLMTFAVANGWTQDQLDTGAGKIAMTLRNIHVQWRWDTTTPLHASMHQSLAFDGVGTDPGLHTDDSGNGYNDGTINNTNLDNERCIHNLGNGPFPSYHFFEDDSGGRGYLHVVVETASEVFRHFGMGELEKLGDNWTGGEYAYGQYWETSSPIGITNVIHLDGLFNDTGNDPRRAATVHIEGHTGQQAGAKWGEIWGVTSGTPPTDHAGNPKENVQGGFRAGPIARNFGDYFAGGTTGLIPGYPVGLWYRDQSSRIYPLGFAPDVRGVNMKNFAPKTEITVGSDIWIPFPTSQKTTASVTNRSYNQGLLYKKVTT